MTCETTGCVTECEFLQQNTPARNSYLSKIVPLKYRFNAWTGISTLSRHVNSSPLRTFVMTTYLSEPSLNLLPQLQGTTRPSLSFCINTTMDEVSYMLESHQIVQNAFLRTRIKNARYRCRSQKSRPYDSVRSRDIVQQLCRTEYIERVNE